MLQKITRSFKTKAQLWMGIFLMLFSRLMYADGGDNPFPKIDVSGGDVVTAVGKKMETSMKYALIGGGIIMLLAGIGVIMHRLREDSSNKDTGSFLTTLVISGLAITVGIILIAIGWTAASYAPHS